MTKTAVEWVDDLVNVEDENTLDGIITHVFNSHVHVRLKENQRRIVTNVHIADHINKKKLIPGRYCKISALFDRARNTGRYILTDILPTSEYGDIVVGVNDSIPSYPTLSVGLDCTNGVWLINWTSSQGAISYRLYAARDSVGTDSYLLLDTSERSYGVSIENTNFIYFAVSAVGPGGESAKSPYLSSDAAYFTQELVQFGDTYLNGYVSPQGTIYRILSNSIVYKTKTMASFVDITPDVIEDTWGDTPDPTIADVTFIQVLGEDGDLYVIGKWQNTSNDWRGALWHYDGSVWTYESLRNDVETELFPIWMAINDGWCLITHWADDELFLQQFTLPLTYDDSQSLGLCTEAEFNSRQYYAFPVTVSDNDSYWLIGGKMTPPTLTICHIAKTDDAGGTFQIVEDGWLTSYCSSLKCLSAESEIIWAVRQ